MRRGQYCKNCDVPVFWGVFCVDCIRAFLVGAATTLGTAAAAWWLW